ncbi:flagellar filament capping protein FliD [Kiloniella laminariae]|uniref:flagellar filament capping protein FliD n=1 Tax=Kiloniella laminariae TaxID=454162 RepID=UPI00035E8752|nr:flagellar filament capping protein FliD [Kiloniella laminariae]
METGALTFVNGVPRITGQYSGFDTNAIVEATLLAKRIPAVRLESTIKQNDLKSEAYGAINTLLQTLKSSLNGLRNPPGLSGLDSNAFETKAAFLTSSNSTPATELLGVSTTNSAVAGTYEVEVLQIATANKISSGTVADATAAQGLTDTLTIGLAGGTTKDISITSSMTLNDIAEAINGVKADTGVRASVIKVADNDFRLIMTAEETGKAITLSGSSGEFLTAYGDGAVLSELQAAKLARIKVDGIATVIERTKNDISDVITGVTLQLYKADVGNNIKVEIQSNLGGVKEKIADFVNAYNAIKDVLIEQRNYDPASASSSKPPLFGDDILRTLETSLSSIISGGAIGTADANFSSLAVLGITLDDNSKLTIDDKKLDAVLISDLDKVRGVFEFSFSSDDSRLRLLGRTKNISVNNFELVINGVDGSGNITGASVTGYGNVFDVSGASLIGKAGTAFEGMTMAFVGTPGSGAQTIQVKTSLGIAENVYQSVDNYIKPGSGLISSRILTLNDNNKDMAEKINAIDSRLELTRQFLFEKYSRLEQSLAQAEASRKQLEASFKQS